MNFFTCLYNLFIGPLELLFEVIFSQANNLLHNPGFSIIFLSLAMNFLVLPLYKRADALQEEQRQTEEKLRPWVDHIRKSFSGDERFMLLQTYYRQNHYRPVDALKGTTSLLLEIPFFIAAYNFLSGLQMLQGVSFGPIRDLGVPDGLLVIGGLSIHVLPIAMTLINLMSSAIYTKGMSAKSKLQLYGMALIFLVLLYDSPSGLVFYWTLNNLFSLVKNIFYKIKNPRLVFGCLSSCVGILGLACLVIFHPLSGLRTQVIAAGALLLLQLPLVCWFAGRKRKNVQKPEVTAADHRGFFLGCCFLAVLTGLLIPSGILEASPEEFVNAATLENPLHYLGNAFLLAAGTFLVWLSIFYMLASPGGKRIMGTCVWILSGCAVIDFMFFGRNYGNLSANLQYDVFPVFAAKAQLINLAVLLAAGAVLWLLYRKRGEIARILYLAAGAAMVVMSVMNIHSAYMTLFGDGRTLEAPTHEEASIPLSRDGKNVVVLMMDRAVGSYLPFIMQERPELQQQFAGFTYYPNTASFGQFTNFGIPAVFGGYEYTPEEMNRRSEEPLVDKHNEALRVLPVLFTENDFLVTMMDPSYAGYHWIPDLHVYDDYPEVRAFNLENSFRPMVSAGEGSTDGSLYRNFFCYSLFKTAPVVAQPMLYAGGTYNEADVLFANREDSRYAGQFQDGTERAAGMDPGYYSFHKELEMLPQLTDIRDGGENTFLFLTNCTTHEPVLLQLPEYEMVPQVDNAAYDAAHPERFTLGELTLPMDTPEQMMHYHINMAAMLQLGQWMDHLREQGVYDNTRIIIVADHGQTLRQIPNMNDPEGADMMSFNPLLMVKDFGSQELTMDKKLMTNADVPMLAMEGLIEDPHNPFTGKPMSENPKGGELHLFVSRESSVTKNNGTRFLPGQWIALKDDLFSRDNWRYIEDPSD